MPPTRRETCGSCLAEAIAEESFSKEDEWMTGPMKFSKAVGGPILRAVVSSMRILENESHALAGT